MAVVAAHGAEGQRPHLGTVPVRQLPDVRAGTGEHSHPAAASRVWPRASTPATARAARARVSAPVLMLAPSSTEHLADQASARGRSRRPPRAGGRASWTTQKPQAARARLHLDALASAARIWPGTRYRPAARRHRGAHRRSSAVAARPARLGDGPGIERPHPAGDRQRRIRASRCGLPPC